MRGLGVLVCPHVVSNGRRGLNNRISVCADQRASVTEGARTSTLFLLILLSLPSMPVSLIAGNLRWRKPPLSVLHSLLFLLCVRFTPPLCALCRPSELSLHFDPSVTTSQAFCPLLFYMEPVPHFLPVAWPFIHPLMLPVSSQVKEFYNTEQTAIS